MIDPAPLAQSVSAVIEIVGIVVIVAGALVATGVVVHRRAQFADMNAALEAYRALLGRAILLGLEFLVAADIIRTVATTPTFASLGILAGIVLIRTFLSLSLGVEIDGRFPWQRGGDRKH